MGKKSGPDKVTNVNKTELPAWVDEAAQYNLDLANDLAARPYSGYGGPLNPDLNPTQQAAIQLGQNNSTMWTPAIQNAGATTAQGMSYRPHSFLEGDVAAYMNPYIQNVEDAALDNMGVAFKQNLNTLGDAAVKAGAFGGSRQAIQEGVANSEASRSFADLSAKLRADAYTQGMDLMGKDIANDITGQQIRLGAAGQLADIANTGNTMGNQNAAMLQNLGGMEYGVQQAQMQEDYAKWKEEADYPLQALNLRLAALGATPYGGTQTQTTTGQSGGGGAMSGFGSLLTGIGAILPFLSDKDMKTDIEKLGKDPDTGLDMYAYRYKGDPKSYPKIVGPMAQDIEKKHPDAVKKVGGKRVVNLGFGG